MAKDLAIVLNNGSINSAVATALAAQKYRPILLYAEAVPQPGSRVRMAYDQQVAHFKPYREHTLPMPFLTALAIDERRGADGGRPAAALAARAADARAAPARRGGRAVRGALPGGGDLRRRCASATQADELAQATEYVQVWNELIQMPCDQPELDVADAAAGAGAVAGGGPRVPGGGAVREDVELRRGRRRAVLGVPRVPRPRGRVPAGGQAGPAAGRAERCEPRAYLPGAMRQLPGGGRSPSRTSRAACRSRPVRCPCP